MRCTPGEVPETLIGMVASCVPIQSAGQVPEAGPFALIIRRLGALLLSLAAQ